MAYWLFKSEPSVWSLTMQIEAGEKGTCWNGVRNHSAKLNMMAMAVGDQGFFYHSNQDKAIVGIVEVIKPYYPDPSDESGKFGMVDIKIRRALPRAVTLQTVKTDPRLAKMALVVYSRLSVQPVTAYEWQIICETGGI